jgi:NAD(P)H-quinone oxidoreductase subunit 5
MIQSIHQYAWLIPLLPTLTAMILGVGLLSTRRIFNSQRLASASISILTLILTMIISIAIFGNKYILIALIAKFGLGWPLIACLYL